MRVPRGPAPSSCVGAVSKKSVIRGCDRIAVFPSAIEDEYVGEERAHPANVANAASWSTSLRRARMRALQDLVDRVDGTFGATIAACDGEEPVQKSVLRVPGFEARGRAKVI